MPDVFITYSREDDDHKLWTQGFAVKLLECGINAIIDEYDMTLGDRLPLFMERSITTADKVLVICTPTYKWKSDNRTGGVGYEGHIIAAELMNSNNEKKFIPVLRKGNWNTSLPTCLAGKLGVDLRDDSNQYEFNNLLTTIYGVNKKPEIGKSPKFIKDKVIKEVEPDEPIHITGIITDEVTVPEMDGSRGSALYKIPFRLSRHPSSLWARLFVDSWNIPPSFTTMHRPGIASVRGDKIILDGTTIEEVKDYHRHTLNLCVEEANRKEKQIVESQQYQKKKEEERIIKHKELVEQIANEIEF